MEHSLNLGKLQAGTGCRDFLFQGLFDHGIAGSRPEKLKVRRFVLRTSATLHNFLFLFLVRVVVVIVVVVVVVARSFHAFGGGDFQCPEVQGWRRSVLKQGR